MSPAAAEQSGRLLLCEIDPYAGPLDLLLFLVKEKRVSIEEIKLTEIADQYVAFMHSMEDDYDLELLSGYMLVAATLVQIKSRMLLPGVENEDEIEEAVDLKAQMLVHMAENLRFEAAAKHLGTIPMIGYDRFVRPAADEGSTTTVWRFPASQDLALAFEQMLVRLRRRVPPILQRSTRALSDHLREMAQILSQKFARATRMYFHEFDAQLGDDTEGRISRFVALLQLVKGTVVAAEQSEISGPIALGPGAKWDQADWEAIERQATQEIDVQTDLQDAP